MNSLVSVKLALKKFAGRNEAFLVPIFKFLITLIALLRISSRIGFMARLNSKPILLIVALAGSFLPLNLTIVIIGFIIIAHMYALSLECAIVVFALFMVLFLLYFRFAAKDSVAGMLTPLSFVFHIPYVMPVSMGLTGTPTSMVSVGSGVVIYHVLHFIAENKTLFSGTADAVAELSRIEKFKAIVDALVKNREMIVLAASFAITVLVVYIIRRLPINFSWFIAIAAGELSLLVVTMVAATALDADISFGGLFVGVIVSTVINLILQYFLFDLNYNRVEKVQFEDDEYYYYVKAVPKNEFVEKENVREKRPVARAVRPVARPVKRPAPTADADEPPIHRTANADHEAQAERTAAALRNANNHSRPAGQSNRPQGARPQGARPQGMRQNVKPGGPGNK